jgi:hypothetical protein
MSKALSLDLRSRVLAAIAGGLSYRKAAGRLGVSASSAIRCARRHGRDEQPLGPICELIEAAGARLLYLPPTSPDCNPIEKRLRQAQSPPAQKPPSAPSTASGPLSAAPSASSPHPNAPTTSPPQDMMLADRKGL